MSYSVARTDTASRYPQDAPYTATVTLAVPSGGVAGDYYIIRVAATDRGPLTVSGTGFVVLQDTKITPIAGERTDGQHVIGRPADGSESGFFAIAVSGGSHDFLADCHLIHCDAGAITVKSVTSACARLGALSTGASAAMASGSSTTTVANQYAFWLGSVASTGAAAPGGSPGPDFPADIVTAAVPPGFTESGRTIDDVGEIALSGGLVVSSPTTATYTGSATVPSGDDYFGFGTTIIFDVVPLAFTGLSATTSAGTLTPHTSGGAMAATWNPSDKNAAAVLSSGNTIMQTSGGGAVATVRSTDAVTGKRYIEVALDMTGGAGLSLCGGVGDAASSMSSSYEIGVDTNSVGLFLGGGSAARIYMGNVRQLAADAGLTAMTASTAVIGIAIDATGRKVWIRDTAVNSPAYWFGGGDPAAGTTPTVTLGGSGSLLIGASDDEGTAHAGKKATFTGDATGYVRTAPSGFTSGLPSASASVALAGQAATNAGGTLAPKLAAAITGLALAASVGTVVPSIKAAFSGQSATSAQGSLSPRISIGASGQAATSASGSFGPSISVPLAGQAAATAQGTLALPSQVVLTGQAAATAQGSLAPAIAAALVGQSASTGAGVLTLPSQVVVTGQFATTSPGLLTPALSVSFVGQSATSAIGPLSPSLQASLTGSAATMNAGNLGPAISAAFAGQALMASAGTLAPFGSIVINGLAATSGQGTLSPAFSAALVGQQAAMAFGTLSPVAVVSVALSGQAISAAASQFAPARSVALVGLSATAIAWHFVDQNPPPAILVSVTVSDIGTRLASVVVSDL